MVYVNRNFDNLLMTSLEFEGIIGGMVQAVILLEILQYEESSSRLDSIPVVSPSDNDIANSARVSGIGMSSNRSHCRAIDSVTDPRPLLYTRMQSETDQRNGPASPSKSRHRLLSNKLSTFDTTTHATQDKMLSNMLVGQYLTDQPS
jgi:hypothetical protein